MYSGTSDKGHSLNKGHLCIRDRSFVHYLSEVKTYCHYIRRLVHQKAVLYTEVSFTQSVLYQRFHCIFCADTFVCEWDSL